MLLLCVWGLQCLGYNGIEIQIAHPTKKGYLVRDSILTYIECPICRSPDFSVVVSERSDVEIREGELVCTHCSYHHPIRHGILNFLPTPTQTIQSEQKGWSELLGITTDEHIRTMLELPHLQDPLWVTTADNFEQIMTRVNVSGRRVLDIGAGRCWSARHLARAGAQHVMALDILLERFIGLETADIFIQQDGLHFERVQSDMNDLPLRASVFDIVFMTGTLHHSSNIKRVLRQIARVLRHGGTALIINEPIHSLFWPHDLSASPERAHGINENSYSILEYASAVISAGMIPQFFFPRSLERRLDHGDPLAAQELGPQSYKIISRLWRHKLGRRAVRGALLLATLGLSNMPLVMLARKF